MGRFIEGADRTQATLLLEMIDDYVGEENPVRVVDAFLDAPDLSVLGFDGVIPEETGPPAYHPATILPEAYEPPKTGGDLKCTAIADVMNAYLKEQAPKTARPKQAAYLATGILDWWGDKHLSEVRAKTCGEYVAWRTAQKRKKRRSGTISDQTARHELNLLSTAINYYHENYGPLTAVPAVVLPPLKGARIDYYLTRKEVADRIRAARRLRKCKHIIRALLIGVYSGTRPGAAMRLCWIPSTAGGWFDLDAEVLHRRAEGEVESNKRQTPCRIHRRLLPWLKRWYRQDMEEGIRRRKRVGSSRVYERVVALRHPLCRAAGEEAPAFLAIGGEGSRANWRRRTAHHAAHGSDVADAVGHEAHRCSRLSRHESGNAVARLRSSSPRLSRRGGKRRRAPKKPVVWADSWA